MKARTSLWAYPWDLADEGIDDAVRLLKNDLMLDAVSVAASYHTYQQIRPHRRDRKLAVCDQAYLYFQPHASLYSDTCISPNVAPLVGEGDPFGQLADRCAAEALGLVAWTVCFHNSFLAGRYAHCAQRTAYGDNLGWCLCPGEDDVRAYAVALCRDLARNYGVSRIELESCNFGAYGHAHYHVKQGVDPGPIGLYLFSLSFSDGCLQKAGQRGIDGEALRKWVENELSEMWQTGKPLPGNLEEYIESHAELTAYQEMREDLVATLIREIRDAAGVEISVLLMGDRWLTGLNRERVAESADLVEALAYTPSPDEVEACVVGETEQGIDASRLVLGLQAYRPCAASQEDLARNVQRGLALGVRRFSYYNYGIMPRANFEWIRYCNRQLKKAE